VQSKFLQQLFPHQLKIITNNATNEDYKKIVFQVKKNLMQHFLQEYENQIISGGILAKCMCNPSGTHEVNPGFL
jgi:hypothetical protein